MTWREHEARHGVVARAALLSVALIAFAPTTLAAQADTVAPPRAGTTVLPPADTVPPAPDTTRLPADTTRPSADTTGAASDTMPAVQLQRMRESMAGGAFPQRDSLFKELLNRKGFRIVEYRGHAVTLRVPDRVIQLVDSAQANYGDAALTADSITYRSRLAFLAARGDIFLASPDQRQVTSDSVLYYDVSRRKGTVLDAHTKFSAQGANWIVNGNAVPVGSDTLFVSRGQFTTCDLQHPHYWFQAGQIKMINQDVIVAWPVTLYIEHVPVFWLPFFAQDIRPNRRSGIIPPQFGINDIVRTSRSTRRNITGFGYYWAINRFMDAEFTGDWYSGSYTQVNTRFRYNDIKKHLQGSVNASEQFSSSGRTLNLTVQHNQELDPNTNIKLDAHYVQSPTTYQNRSFDPNQQTQTIDSNVSLHHQLSWATLDMGARRQQFLGPNGQIQLTLPSVNLSFSPVTLFQAPTNREGLFNNLVWSGSGTFNRNTQTSQLDPDTRQTTASASQSIRLHDLNIQSSANLADLFRTPKDTLGKPLPAFSQTAVNWQASADYQIGLMGSTTLRPTVSVSGGEFRSLDRADSIPDTNNQFVTAPVRASVGATLSTDLYAFFPGFGPFTKIRHKISPRLSWSYRPAVGAADSLSNVPGFPGGSFQAQNVLTVGISQTFEAKVRESAPPEEAGRGRSAPDTTGAARDTTGAARDTTGAARDTTGAAGDTTGAGRDTTPGALASGRRSGAPAAPRTIERKVTILSINTTTPLQFDFAAKARGQPLLQTDQITNSFSSDLIRGFSLNMTHDLFDGTGPTRHFSPFLARLNASFSISSGTSIGSLFGLGGGGGRTPPPRQQTTPGGKQETRGGPWSLSLSYSLNRHRPNEPGFNNSTLQWSLNMQPTPNWRVNWSSSYSFTDHQFAQQTVDLTRTLHRWQATFHFTKSPNGNFLFSFQVSLSDVPPLHVGYDQRSGLSQ